MKNQKETLSVGVNTETTNNNTNPNNGVVKMKTEKETLSEGVENESSEPNNKQKFLENILNGIRFEIYDTDLEEVEDLDFLKSSLEDLETIEETISNNIMVFKERILELEYEMEYPETDEEWGSD